MKNCLNCGKEIPNRNKYCNNQCQRDFEYKQFIYNWKNGINNGTKGSWGQLSNNIKRYLFESIILIILADIVFFIGSILFLRYKK